MQLLTFLAIKPIIMPRNRCDGTVYIIAGAQNKLKKFSIYA